MIRTHSNTGRYNFFSLKPSIRHLTIGLFLMAAAASRAQGVQSSCILQSTAQTWNATEVAQLRTWQHTSSGCAPTYAESSDTSWLSLPNGSAISGGSYVVKLVANVNRTSRTGYIYLRTARAGLIVHTLTVKQAATCYITPVDLMVPGASGGTGQLRINLNRTGCPWTVSSNQPWLRITQNVSGTASATVAFAVDKNFAIASRLATLSARGATLSAGGASVVAIQPGMASCGTPEFLPSTVPFPPEGGTKSTYLSYPAGCQWTIPATSKINYQPTAGNGSMSLVLTVPPNEGPAWALAVPIAGRILSVSQEAKRCQYTVNLAAIDAPADGGTYNIGVEPSAGNCSWGGIENISWIDGSTQYFTGNGTYTVTVRPHTFGESRVAQIQVADRMITVRQAGYVPPARLRERTFDSDGLFDLMIYRPYTTQWLTVTSSNTMPPGFMSHPWNSSDLLFHTLFGQANVDRPVSADYDGDGRRDAAISNPNGGGLQFLPSSGVCPSLFTTEGPICTLRNWGLGVDEPLAGDFDGDGKADPAAYRRSEDTWYLMPSGGVCPPAFDYAGIYLGSVHCKLLYGNRQDAIIRDFDGDGKSDVGQFSHRDGRWDMMPSSGACPARWTVREVHNGRNICGAYFGVGSDAPAAADYDGDGIADLGFWRQQNELLMITPSSGVCPGHVPYYTVWDGFSLCARAVPAGNSVPVPADYDADGKKDVAQYTPSTGLWTLVPSSNQCPSRVRETQTPLIDGWIGCGRRFGDPTDVPIR